MHFLCKAVFFTYTTHVKLYDYCDIAKVIWQMYVYARLILSEKKYVTARESNAQQFQYMQPRYPLR